MRRRAILRGVLAAVSPLCSSRQGAMAGDALRLPPCPLRLPLLFPKNLAALRFSGALFVFRAHLYQNAAASPFLREPQVCGKWGALTERRSFRTRRDRL